ncbi:DUF4381 domain-containing protein [Methylobacterium radiodurans]|uniref:DUF4381 domain-containing protein n=1 Tax=Methylobacterium radiodurans TaxID=2202828 RepID=A0A2U8VNF9_9HYPH|nr:DUF4381 domain-containing protein [Methylobacterium radiodurans]AWN34971.1 DUF4381 domain-containing protein [Methylobacterium radiodurans]
MNPETAAALDQLRGLHLPGNAAGALQGEVVAAALVGFATALGIGLFRFLRSRAGTTLRRSALRELAATRELPPEARLVAQARLLRRIARTRLGEEAAAAHGAEWAARLDRLFATDLFSAGAGRVLVDGLYRRHAAPDAAALDAELGRLIGRMRA